MLTTPSLVEMVVEETALQICKTILQQSYIQCVVVLTRPTHGVQLLNYTVKDYIYNEPSMAQDLQQVSPLSVTVNANIWQDYRGDVILY